MGGKLIRTTTMASDVEMDVEGGGPKEVLTTEGCRDKSGYKSGASKVRSVAKLN